MPEHEILLERDSREKRHETGFAPRFTNRFTQMFTHGVRHGAISLTTLASTCAQRISSLSARPLAIEANSAVWVYRLGGAKSVLLCGRYGCLRQGRCCCFRERLAAADQTANLALHTK